VESDRFPQLVKSNHRRKRRHWLAERDRANGSLRNCIKPPSLEAACHFVEPYQLISC